MQGLALGGEEHRSALAEGESGAPPVGRGGEGRGGCAEEQLPCHWVWAVLGQAVCIAGLRIVGGFLPSSLHRWFAL